MYYKLAEDSGTGVFPVTFTEYLPEQSPDPWWKSAVRDFRRVNPDEIPSIYKDGYLFEVPFVDTSVYMPWLLSRFKQLGGTIHQKELFSLEEINADLVVNCSGLGARFLANDLEVYPVRGQGIRVKAKNNGGCFLDQQSELEAFGGEIIGAIPFRDRWVGNTQTTDSRETIAAMKELVEGLRILPTIRESEQFKKALRQGCLLSDLGHADLQHPFEQVIEVLCNG